MSSSSSKRCFSRLVFNNRSILFQQHVSAQSSAAAASLTKHQFTRHYAGSPPLHLYRNFFKNKSKLRPNSSTSPSSHSSSSYRSYCSSSSSSSKNGFVGWYLGMIEARPVLTKSVSSALIYTFADLSSQAITRKSEDSFDLVRTIRMAGYGMLVMGPSLHFWFNFVSKILPKRDVLTTLKKIFIGQTTYGPIMTTVFFSVNAGLQGESSEEIGARLKRDLLPTLTNGLMYWPICDFVTFKFIPVRLQPLVSNSFAYLWTIYITYMATLEKADTSSISAVDSTS